MMLWVVCKLAFILCVVTTCSVYSNELKDFSEYDAVTDLIDALANEEAYEITEEVVSDDFEHESPHMELKEYEKYAYEHVPDHILTNRRGYKVEDVDIPCEGEEPDKISDHDHPHSNVGSLPGRPGIDYPNYTEIPLTSFSCEGRHVPAFYADPETDCQVFHVCYPHRRESFLCPVGTTFNQPILACDYWYNGNCSAASGYYEVEENYVQDHGEDDHVIPTEIVYTEEPETTEPETTEPVQPTTSTATPIVIPIVKPIVKKPIVSIKKPAVPIPPIDAVSSLLSQFLPIKAKVITKLAAAKKPIAAKVLVSAVKPKLSLLKPQPIPFKVPVYKPMVSVPVKPMPIPVATLVKAALSPTVKTAVSGHKILIGKPKFLAPVAKPLIMKTAVKVKKAKLASFPLIALLTKKHLASAAARAIKSHHGPQYARAVYRY